MDITQDVLYARGPKNKKQIGRIGKGDKIYIEDYAVTYLNQIARAPETKNGFAGLFGTCREIGGVKEYYIYAAVYQECEKNAEGGLPRETVQKIMRCRGELFAEYFFLGWALIYSENKGTMWEHCYRSRMETLMGCPELLMTIKCKTCEEHFYLYPTEMPKQTDGYFIFYEQNDAMQNFLIDWHGEIHKDKCDEEGDNVAESCRNYYKEKKAKRFRNRLAAVASMAAMLLLLFVLGTSVQSLNGYDKIKEAGQTVEEVNQMRESSAEQLVPISWETMSEESAEVDLATETDALQAEMPEEESIVTEDLTEAGENIEEEEIVLKEDSVEEEVVIVGVESPETEEMVMAEEMTETEETEAETENAEPQEFVEEEKIPEEVTEIVKIEEEEPTAEEIVALNESVETSTSIEEYITYEVSKGDTLYGICVRFYGNLHQAEEICNINNIEDMNNILYGQKILLPQ
ncbi:MAG: LysM peptidoglycan-binding domain-containing protein [Lachnospiraceae bacterium]|nr:LysM peptidoglycan-binding domain-containing protein [Lachnospiraceae bacterium]